jgi:hypothetical protein
MARTFNGTSDKIDLALGAVPALATTTIAAICRRTTAAVDAAIFSNNVAAGWTLYVINSGAGANANKLAIHNGTTDVQGPTLVTADDWCLIAVTKATGTTTPRFHKYVYSTDTWTHVDASGTLANSGAASTSNRIGDDGGDFFKGDIASVGIWDAQLVDAQVESLASSLPAWFQAQPKALWLLDQSATTQKVVDIAGGGANESALTGTTVATGSVPVFSYGDGIWTPTIVKPAGGGPAARTAVDTLGTTDAVTRGALAFSRAASDALGTTDVAARSALLRARTASDSLGTTDSASRAPLGLQRSAADTLGTTDSVTGGKFVSRTASDTLGTTDVAVRGALALTRTAADSLSTTDTATRAALLRARTAGDTLGTTDTAARAALLARAAADSLSTTDTASRPPLLRPRTATDSLATTDTAAGALLGNGKTASDTLGTTDTATRAPLFRARTASDTLATTDSTTRAVTRYKTAADTLATTDTATSRLVFQAALRARRVGDNRHRGTRDYLRTRAANDTLGTVDAATGLTFPGPCARPGCGCTSRSRPVSAAGSPSDRNRAPGSRSARNRARSHSERRLTGQ